jgi:excisionase family DNA binding protein
MGEPIVEGWLSTAEAKELTGYSSGYLRRMAKQGRIEASKVCRDWLFHCESLLAYKTRMDTLGNRRHDPWREELTEQKRGRRRD